MTGAKALTTAEQLEREAGTGRMELVRGEVVQMSPVGRKHGRVVIRLGRLLDEHVSMRRLGEVSTEVGFILSRGPDTVRAPDIAFVSAGRLHAATADGFFTGAPDLAVEVVSPDDRAGELIGKVREYLEAGTRLLWVVDPRSETVTAYLPTGEARVHSGADPLSADPVVPGFAVVPAALFAER